MRKQNGGSHPTTLTSATNNRLKRAHQRHRNLPLQKNMTRSLVMCMTALLLLLCNPMIIEALSHAWEVKERPRKRMGWLGMGSKELCAPHKCTTACTLEHAVVESSDSPWNQLQRTGSPHHCFQVAQENVRQRAPNLSSELPASTIVKALQASDLKLSDNFVR